MLLYYIRIVVVLLFLVVVDVRDFGDTMICDVMFGELLPISEDWICDFGDGWEVVGVCVRVCV